MISAWAWISQVDMGVSLLQMLGDLPSPAETVQGLRAWDVQSPLEGGSLALLRQTSCILSVVGHAQGLLPWEGCQGEGLFPL